MFTAQHTEEVVIATGRRPFQLHAALLLRGFELGDAVAVLETVVSQVASLCLADSIDGCILLKARNLQR